MQRAAQRGSLVMVRRDAMCLVVECRVQTLEMVSQARRLDILLHLPDLEPVANQMPLSDDMNLALLIHPCPRRPNAVPCTTESLKARRDTLHLNHW